MKSLRVLRGWNQAEFAFRVDISPTDVSQIELGRRDIRADTLLRIVVVLNTSADYLFGLTDTPHRAR